MVFSPSDRKIGHYYHGGGAKEIEAGLVYHIIPSENMDDRIYKAIDEIMAASPEQFKERGQKYVASKIDVVEFIFNELLDLVNDKYL